MSQSEARAWWADVEEVRATIERRRAAERPFGDDGRGHEARADVDVDDLAVRRRFRGRERPGADGDASFDEPAAPRPAAGPRARAPEGPSSADRRAAMAALAPAASPPAGAAPRRTVQITGRTVPAPHVVPFDRVASDRRRPATGPGRPGRAAPGPHRHVGRRAGVRPHRRRRDLGPRRDPPRPAVGRARAPGARRPRRPRPPHRPQRR